MLSSTLPDNPEDAELAVITNISRSSSFTKLKPSSDLPKRISSSLSTSSSSSSESETKEEEKSNHQNQTEIKNSSGNLLLGRNMTPMHFIIIYNREILCFLTLFLTTYATFHNKYGSRTPYYPINSCPIFDKESVVEEFHKGQLTPLQTKVSVSGISAILFYAPWSTNSLYVKQYFESLAKTFQNEIYFAAVNCWQPGGECRMQHSKVKSWPVLVVYYPKSLAVQYNGPWQLGPIYKFLIGVLKPIQRLHSYNELKLFNTRHSVVVVGFFTKIDGKYQSFYHSAVKWLEYDPLQDVKFCTVVGDVLKDFNITNESEIRLFYRGNRILENFYGWSVNSIVNSVKKYTKSLAKYWSGYHRQDSESLNNYLKSNPSLLYFVKRDYLNDNSTAELILNEVIEMQNFKLFLKGMKTSSNISEISEAENLRNFENSSASDNIISRKTEIKKSLSYFLLDIFMYYKLAFQLGLNNSNFQLQQSTVVIVDNFKESIFVFPSTIPLTSVTLNKFIIDYKSNNLKRNFRNKNITTSYELHNNNAEILNTNHRKNNQINISEITGQEFKELIQNRSKNKSTGVILITSATCSLCSNIKLNLLRISKILKKLSILFYRVDGDNNDFIWEYTMGRYPTLLIIPKINKNKINDIRILPYDMEPNDKNILGFIMANLDASERLFGLLKFCGHLKNCNGFHNCLKTTRHTIVSIINEQLTLWRNFIRRRKCILNNLSVLRDLYYKLINSKNAKEIKSAFKILHSQKNQIDIKFVCDNEEKNILIS